MNAWREVRPRRTRTRFSGDPEWPKPAALPGFFSLFDGAAVRIAITVAVIVIQVAWNLATLRRWVSGRVN